MQGEFPNFKPCHRISAAKELLQRGFDYVPEDQDAPEAGDADALEPEPEPELTSEDLAAQRRAERIEFSKHGPRYYRNYAFPCVCEDRLHDCTGNPLDDGQLEAAALQPPVMEHFILTPEQMDDFLARYAEYLIGWNAEHPGNPIDFNRIRWNSIRWRDYFKSIRGP